MLPTWLLRKTNAESGSLLHPTKSAATAPRAPTPVSLTAAALRDDVAALAATLGPDPSLRCDLVSTGSTYTRLWTEEDWRQHASICRYSRHLRFWHKSTIARAIAPLVAAATLWAAAVAVFGERYPNYRLSLPFQPMLLFGQAITLLLTMRTNASLARLAEARALAANYMSRIVDPVINPAICYVRMQKPKPDRCCECILDYLKSLQDGDPLAPDRSSLKKPNVAIPDDQSQIIAKCLAEVIGQQPSKDEVLGLLVKAFEKAVDN